MESDMLINAVRGRRAIWDASAKQHGNRDYLKKLWEEISNELDVECDYAKRKWKSLRENYRKELKKYVSTTGQMPGNNGKPKWSYYDDMSFLQDQFIPRETTESVDLAVNFAESYEDSPIVLDGTTKIEIEEEKEQQEEGRKRKHYETALDISLPSTSTSSNQAVIRSGTSPKRHDQRRPYRCKKTLLQKMEYLVDKKVVEYLQRGTARQEVHDADYHFLISLLPSLRAIPAHRKMSFRRKIEGLFLEEEESNSQG